MIRTILLSLALMPGLSAPAQQPSQPPAGSNWQHVQALPIGASIQVHARKSHANCNLKSVDADTLTCTRGKDLIFQRIDILTTKIPRREHSALIGMAIGAGAGTIVGAASGRNGSFAPRDVSAIAFGVVGAPIGAAVGALTDFAKSTVYKAP
jgi:uncharacterized protein YcfJ